MASLDTDDEERSSISRRLFLAGVLLVPASSAAVLSRWVAASSDDDTEAPAPSPAVYRPAGFTGADIQQAIDAAHGDGGGTVLLSGGTYTSDEHLHVRTGVALRGTGPASVIKAGPGFLRTRGPLGGYPLITTNGSSDVTVADLTADQSGDVLDGNVPGRLTEFLVDGRYSTNLLIENVRTRNPFAYSIAVVASSQFVVRGCSTLVTSQGRYDQLDGIHVLQSSFGEVSGNNIDQGGPEEDGDDGIALHTISGGDCHDLLIRDNTVRGGRHGAAMQFALGQDDIYNVVITNNTFYGSVRGLHARRYGVGGALSHVTIGGDQGDGNEFRHIRGPSVDLAGWPVEHVVVTHNTAVESGGFLVREDPTNRLSDNELIEQPDTDMAPGDVDRAT